MTELINLFLRVVFPLLIGGFTYLFFRSDSLLMFTWCNSIGILSEIKYIRNILFEIKFPSWVIYNLPDGLWVFSYVNLMLIIWKCKIKKNSIIWISFIPILAIVSELLQLNGLVFGTFDWRDILFYLLGSMIPILQIINSKINHIQRTLISQSKIVIQKSSFKYLKNKK